MTEQLVKDILSSINVPRETFSNLQKYVDLLIKWNKVINLISLNEIERIWEKHILICAELMLHIENKDIKLIDLGSGGGLPGVVLSIMGVKEVVLIESNSKKASFLLQAAQISPFKIHVINDRIENQTLTCDIITSRALAPIDKLLILTKYIQFSDRMVLIKGANAENEIDYSQKFNFDILSSKYSQNSSIVVIKKLS